MSTLTLPESANPPDQVPLHFALLLFPAFQALDAFGPLDALNTLSFLYPSLRLSILSHSLAPVSTLPDPSLLPPKPNSPPNITNTFEQRILPTHTYTSPPSDIDILIIPGGIGTRAQFRSSWDPLVSFLNAYLTRPDTTLKAIFTVCTGSMLLARATIVNGAEGLERGFLDNINATTNKVAFRLVKGECPRVNWLQRARWVWDFVTLRPPPTGEGSGGDSSSAGQQQEIKVWTCSGVSAGLDGIFAFIAEEYGEEVADLVARFMEYERRRDPNDDPFAVADSSG